MSLIESMVSCLRTTRGPYIAISSSFPVGTSGSYYAGFVHGSNAGGATGALAYGVDTLPAGLSLNPSTGDITGVPSSNGTFHFTVSVTNGSQSHDVHIVGSIGINPAGGSNSAVITGTLADGTIFNTTVPKGSRVPLVAGSIQKGSAIFHGDGMSVCIENAYMGVLNDLVGNFTVTVAGVQLFTGPLTIWCYARTRPFWVSPPTLVGSPDLSMMPKFGPNATSASAYASYIKADNSPMGIGIAHPHTADQGEFIDFGCLAGWDANWITNPSDENLIVVRGMSDAAAPWIYHAIDPVTNLMPDMSSNPFITRNGTFLGANGNPIVPYTSQVGVTRTKQLDLNEAPAHAPMFCVLACAIYATDYDKEELAMWANYVFSIWGNPGYRLAHGGLSAAHDPSRGTARAMSVVLYAAKLTGKAAYFSAWIDDLLVFMRDYYLSVTGIRVDPTNGNYPRGAFAPWQGHLLLHSLGVAIDHGFTGYQEILDFFGRDVLDSMLEAPHELASCYSMDQLYEDGSRIPSWAAAVTQAAIYSPSLAAALDYPESSLQFIKTYEPAVSYHIAGDFSGYCINGLTARSSILRGALVALYKHGTDQTRAQAAWTKFLLYDRADYNISPKYYVVP